MLAFERIPYIGTNFDDVMWTPGIAVPEDDNQETEEDQTDVKQTDIQDNNTQQGDMKQSSKLPTEENEMAGEDEEPVSKLCDSCRSGDLDSIQVLLDSGVNPSSKNQGGFTALHVASLAGRPDVVGMLLDHQCSANVTDGKGWTSLHLACLAGKTDVAELLVQHGAKLEEVTCDGVTALHVASRYGNLGVVRFLLENGASVDAQQRERCRAYPLHVAAFYGHPDVVELLIQFGARVESQDRNRWLPLHYACQKGREQVVDLLLSDSATSQQGRVACQTSIHRQQLRVDCLTGHTDLVRDLLRCGVSTRDADGKTTVCRSCYLANKSALENLTLHSAYPDHGTKGGFTGLYLAAQNGNANVVKTLLRAGACTEVKTDIGWTPLHVASYMGHVHVVNLLLEYKTSVDVSHDRLLLTPLHLACREGHEAVADSLLLHGASPDTLNNHQLNPLHQACMHGRSGVLSRLLPKVRERYDNSDDAERLLLLACSDGNPEVVQCLLDWLPNLTKGSHAGPIHAACSSGNVLTVTILLRHDYFVDAAKERGFEEGWTPLHTASEKDFDEIAEVLIMYGATINKADSQGCTPLHIACQNGSVKVAMVLLEKGSADTEVRDDEGRTALHLAVNIGNEDLVTALLEKGSADTEARDNEGLTTLHIAAKKGKVSAIRVLLETGSPDVEAKDSEGKTALHNAARRGSHDIVKMLIASSADVNATDLQHQSPLMLTTSQEVLETLLANNADVNIQSSGGNTALHMACAARGRNETDKNRLSKVKMLLDHGAHVNVADDKGSTPLHLSCFLGDVDVLKLLVQHGAAVGVLDKDGNTPLHLACIKGHAPAVTTLLEAGANDEDVNHEENTPLHLACLNLQADAVRVILGRGATNSTTIKNKDGQTPLTVIQSMKLEQPQSVPVQPQPALFPLPFTPPAMLGGRQQQGFSLSPVMAPTKAGHAAFTSRMMHNQLVIRNQEEKVRKAEEENAERKRKIDLRNEIMFLFLEHSQCSSLPEAAGSKRDLDSLQEGDLEDSRKKEFDSVPKSVTSDKDKIIQEESTKAHRKSLKEETVDTTRTSSTAVTGTEKEVNQLKATADTGQRQTETEPAVEETSSDAANGANSEIDNAVSITEQRHSAGRTPPGQQRHDKICNIDDELTVEEASSPIHAACYRGNTSSLLGHLPTLTDINFPSRSGRTALHYACAGGHSDIAALLLKLNAGMKIRDVSGKTPLHYACLSGRLDTVDLLLTQEADVHASDGEGRTALHAAACNGHGMVSAVLLARGASVDVCDHSGNTPLILAVLGGHSDVCIYLLNSGANPETANKEGQSPATLVNSGTFPSLAKILARHTSSRKRCH